MRTALIQGASRGLGLALASAVLESEPHVRVVATSRFPVRSQGLGQLADVDPARLRRAFDVDAVGPLLVAKHFLPFLAHDQHCVLANISARVVSIGDNRAGGWYGYRASKAAQNMFTRNLAIELRRRAPNAVVVALHPGSVDTELSRPFQRGVAPDRLFTPDRAARQLLEILDRVRPEESGAFLGWDGSSLPW